MKIFWRLFLAITVGFCISCGALRAAAADDIVLPEGQTDFTITVHIPESESAYASADIDVVIDNGATLDIKKDSANKPLVVFAEGITGSVAEPRTSGNRVSYLVGYLSSDGDNEFSDAQDAFSITFSYTGSSPQVIRIANIRFHRYTGDSSRGVPQYSHETSDVEYVYNVVRNADGSVTVPDPDDDDDADPGDESDSGDGLDPGDGHAPGNETPNGGGDTGSQTGDPTDASESGVGSGSAPVTVGGNNSNLSDSSTLPGGDAGDAAGWNAPFISGYEDGTVRPDAPLTRAELSQIIFNLFGEGETYDAPDYTDVTDAHWAHDSIGFCQEQGYLIGYPDGGFMPEQALTRAELCAAFVRINGLTLSEDHPFADASGHWASEYIGAAYAAEYIIGYPDGSFGADNEITRAEAVALICRALGRNTELFDIQRTFSDLSEDHWSYNYVMNAANGYEER